MKKTFCDICQKETRNWNSGFTVDYEDNGVRVEIVGAIQASKSILFEETAHYGRHSIHPPIDVCKECFIKILTRGTIRR